MHLTQIESSRNPFYDPKMQHSDSDDDNKPNKQGRTSQNLLQDNCSPNKQASNKSFNTFTNCKLSMGDSQFSSGSHF